MIKYQKHCLQLLQLQRVGYHSSSACLAYPEKKKIQIKELMNYTQKTAKTLPGVITASWTCLISTQPLRVAKMSSSKHEECNSKTSKNKSTRRKKCIMDRKMWDPNPGTKITNQTFEVHPVSILQSKSATSLAMILLKYLSS